MLTHKFFSGAFLYPAGDAWTLPGYFAGVPDQYGPIRFTYRPVLVLERDTFLQATATLAPDGVHRKLAQLLANRVKSWNVAQLGPDGQHHEAAPITAETFLKLHTSVWNRFVNLIFHGSVPSDRDPEWSNDDTELNDDAALEAVISGKPIGDATVDKLAKN